MADDLEAFLRQAAQRRAERKKPAQLRPTQPKPRPPSRQRPTHRPPSSEAQIVEAVVIPDSPGRLETHVDTSKFEQRAEHLGEEVGLADEHLVEHLHERFDHRLGALDDAPGMPEDVDTSRENTSSTASEIAALLANPDSLRNAIVLSEILSPPQHRW